MANTRVSGAQVQISGTLDMRGNRITGLETDVNVYPNSPDEGATKAYVDFKKLQIEADLPALANNGTY
jgi:hypothetical protein